MAAVTTYVDNKSRLRQHLLGIGIHHREATRFTNLVSKWLDESGPEWTVERLKSLRTSYIHWLTGPDGHHYDVPDGWARRTNRRGQTIFNDGLIHKMFVHRGSRKVREKAHAFFRSYLTIIAKSATQGMRSQFIESVTATLEEGGANIDVVRVTNNEIKEFVTNHYTVATPRNISQAKSREVILPNMFPNDNKRAPMFDGFISPMGIYKKSLRSSSRRDYRTKEFFELFQSDGRLRTIWKMYPEQVSLALTGTNALPYMDLSPAQFENFHSQTGMFGDSQPYGTIGFIMEGGWKNRAVASVSLPVQALAEPLKRKLKVLSDQIPTIYTEDQDGGHERIRTWLQQGHTLYCFDGTAFTDRFPFSSQLEMLKGLKNLGWVDQFDIDVCYAAAMAEYKLPARDSEPWFHQNTVKYSVGQPMGLGPSFHMFCICHATIVAMVAKNMGFEDYQHDQLFCIVGDDIVINNELLAQGYRKVIEGLGVKINLTKSIISDRFGEFCGKIISIDGPDKSSKVKPMDVADSVVRAVDFYGKGILPHLSHRQKLLAVKATLPEWAGGLSLRQLGHTYKEWTQSLDVDSLVLDQMITTMRQKLGVTQAHSLQKHFESRERYRKHSLSFLNVIKGLEWENRRSRGINDLSGLTIQYRNNAEHYEQLMPDDHLSQFRGDGLKAIRHDLEKIHNGSIGSGCYLDEFKQNLYMEFLTYVKGDFNKSLLLGKDLSTFEPGTHKGPDVHSYDNIQGDIEFSHSFLEKTFGHKPSAKQVKLLSLFSQLNGELNEYKSISKYVIPGESIRFQGYNIHPSDQIRRIEARIEKISQQFAESEDWFKGKEGKRK